MKQIICCLLILFIQISCSNKEVTEDSIITNESSSLDSETLREKFMPYFSGVWTMSEYLEDLAETKSPLKSSEKLNGITVIIFGEGPKANEVAVSSSLNNHEGFGFNILFTKGANDKSLKTDIGDVFYDNKGGFIDIEVSIEKSDTTLNLCIYNADKSLSRKVAFKKIRESQPVDDHAWGINYYVNELIFEGQFIMIDSIQGIKNIKLTADGSIYGFDNYKNYVVTTDFGTRVENNLDNIYIYRTESDYDIFLYKLIGDTINIYKPIYVDEEMITYGYREQVCTMIRKK
jgi:hypothetical protein